MEYNFTKLASKRARLKEPPTMVSIVKGGKTITVTRPALELIGSPDAIVYMIDTDATAFAIRPASNEDVAAYPVRWQDSGRSALISFGNVAASLGLETERLQRHKPVVHEGMLIVDLGRSDRNGTGDAGD